MLQWSLWPQNPSPLFSLQQMHEKCWGMSAFSFSVAPLTVLYPLSLIPRPVWMAWNKAIKYCPFSCLSVDGIPYDGVPENETVTVHISATVTLGVLATCGIIMTVVFLIFNFVFRERKWVVLVPYKCLLHTCMYVCVCVVLLREVASIHCHTFHGIICL